MLKAGVALNFMLEAEARKLVGEGILVIWEQERFAQALSFVTLRSEQADGRVQLITDVIDGIW